MPEAPAVVSRDAAGRATVRATRVAEPIRLDGRLDDEVYARVSPISDFFQIEPREGESATQKTEAWLLFDDDYVYLAARCWESRPDRMVASEMRRDNPANYMGSDNVSFLLDTFYDRQNGIVLIINPAGGRNDGQVTNDRQWNGDWNPVYDFKVGRFEGGWTVEVAVPFKSLRYAPGRSQVWGFNVVRNNFWKNELSSITRMPAVVGIGGALRSSMAATVVGIEAPHSSSNVEVKPAFVSHVSSDRAAVPVVSNAVDADFGMDVKYGISQSVTADLTYRTDFAQVEADEQQVNLTRFSLFFPEKREFFLENRGLFEFGGAGGMGGGGGNTPVLFYSRQIGLSDGGEVPIVLGGRLTGRVGRYSMGLLNIQTGEETDLAAPATNFMVARVKRDILRKSNVGVMFTGRSTIANGEGTNQAFGADGTFAFFDNLVMNAYWARTRTTEVSGHDTSYRAQLDYSGDRYGVQLERLAVGDNFNPEVGFLRRDDIRRSYGQFRFSPRLRASSAVRKLSWLGNVELLEDGAGATVSRIWNGEFATEMQTSDRYSLAVERTYELLTRPFPIAKDVVLAPGGYDYQTMRLGLSFGQQRRVAGTVTVEHGTFYSGHKTSVSVSRGRIDPLPRLSLEPSLSINRVELAEGSFTARLVGSRVTYTMTPRMFASTLLQYNSATNTLSSNARLRWEYRPGSELFVVYNEQRDTLGVGVPGLSNRSLTVKVSRLVRF